MGSGLFLYDALAGLHSAVPRHRHLSQARLPAPRAGAARRRPLRRHPLLRRPDGRLALRRGAGAHGGGARRRLRRRRARPRPCCATARRVAGARLQDTEGGGELDLRARVVVNATGVWTTEVERLAGVDRPALRVRPSKGIHLVVPKDRIESDYALILPTEKSVLFVLPWDGHWIIGTTDTDWHYDLDHPAATRADIEYLLEHVNTVLAQPAQPRRRRRRVRRPAAAGRAPTARHDQGLAQPRGAARRARAS